MLPAGHFAVGMSIPFAISMGVYLKNRGRVTFRYLVWTPLSMFLGGIWALGPDWYRYLAILLRKPWAYSPEAHQPGWTDIFFFHGHLDLLGHTGAVIGPSSILLMFATLIFIYLRKIKELMDLIEHKKRKRR